MNALSLSRARSASSRDLLSWRVSTTTFSGQLNHYKKPSFLQREHHNTTICNSPAQFQSSSKAEFESTQSNRKQIDDSDMQDEQEPTTEEAIRLFRAVQDKFSTTTLGPERWYLLILSTIINTYPHHAATLYTYLLSLPPYKTSETRQYLLKRIREALLKSVPILGIPKPLDAIFNITAVTASEDQDHSFSRGDWKSGPENVARGKDWFNQIYFAKNREGTATKLDLHKDFRMVTEEITYGLFLSDLSTLDGIETEIVVLSGISIQNLKTESKWHLRGIRRVGMCLKDVQVVQECIEMVAKFCGTKTNRVPSILLVEEEVENDQLD